MLLVEGCGYYQIPRQAAHQATTNHIGTRLRVTVLDGEQALPIWLVGQVEQRHLGAL
ncbi:hypothetical protein D3C72_2339440 [compost metagenome]